MTIQQPPYGRKESFDLTFEYLHKKRPGSFLIELGSTRARGGWEGDGYSTPFFAWIAEVFGFFFYSVDINPAVTAIAKSICAEYGLGKTKLTTFVAMDGIKFLKTWRDAELHVDFLYLDAWDYSEGQEKLSEEKHLEAFITIEKNMAPDSLLLIDDIHDTETFKGKGRLVIPYVLKNGFKPLYLGYQCLFQKTGGVS